MYGTKSDHITSLNLQQSDQKAAHVEDRIKPFYFIVNKEFSDTRDVFIDFMVLG